MTYRTTPQIRLCLDDMVIDNFAGGGGASTGIEAAMGRPVDVAINHDQDAIDMHSLNHPGTMHLCESVWDVDPREVTGGRPVALAWFSPDCKHFSRAKGAVPVDKNIRGLAWVAVRYAATVRPRVIILENVEEFRTWGPVVDGRPCPRRKGRTFGAFTRALERLGYRVETNVLRASDYGVPTIRQRLFLVARCDGLPIVWPTPTHGDPAAPGFRRSGLKPWKTAADVIDWSLPCPSIFNRRRPLADNTMQRIARGVWRYVIDHPQPFIVGLAHSGGDQRRSSEIRRPLSTIHAGGGNHALVIPFLAKHYGGNYSGPGSDIRQPLHTVTAVDHNALVAAHLVNLKGSDRRHRAVDLPAPAICAGGTHIAEVRAFLVKYYSEGGQWQDCRDPMHTIPTRDRIALVTVHGEPYQIVDIGMRMLTPRELFRAQGFPEDYIIDRDPQGRPVPNYKQVARVGNSVPPGLAQALVRCNVVDVARSVAA